jgi:hypothetical protein
LAAVPAIQHRIPRDELDSSGAFVKFIEGLTSAADPSSIIPTATVLAKFNLARDDLMHVQRRVLEITDDSRRANLLEKLSPVHKMFKEFMPEFRRLQPRTEEYESRSRMIHRFFRSYHSSDTPVTKVKFLNQVGSLDIQHEHAVYLKWALGKVYEHQQHPIDSPCCRPYLPQALRWRFRPQHPNERKDKWFGSIEEAWADYLEVNQIKTL